MHTIEYKSTREEIWQLYWRAWARPAGLWRYHILLGIIFAAASTMFTGSGNFDIERFLATLPIAIVLSVALLTLWPQLTFKAARRSLTFDADSWTFRIGKLSGSRTWAQTAAIEDDGDTITIIGTDRKALVVPRRAFSEEAVRRQFLKDARRWHRAVAATNRAK